MNRLKKHQTADQIRTVMQRAVELELLRKRFASLLKTCEDIEQILTFVPATHEHVLPTLRKAIADAKRKPNGALR